jgi:hypothetical protein
MAVPGFYAETSAYRSTELYRAYGGSVGFAEAPRVVAAVTIWPNVCPKSPAMRRALSFCLHRVKERSHDLTEFQRRDFIV